MWRRTFKFIFHSLSGMYVWKLRSLPHVQLWAMLLEQVCWLH